MNNSNCWVPNLFTNISLCPFKWGISQILVIRPLHDSCAERALTLSSLLLVSLCVTLICPPLLPTKAIYVFGVKLLLLVTGPSQGWLGLELLTAILDLNSPRERTLFRCFHRPVSPRSKKTPVRIFGEQPEPWELLVGGVENAIVPLVYKGNLEETHELLV